MYSTIAEMADADRLAVGAFAWDRDGVPVALDAQGWFQVGGDRIADLAERLPLVVPLPPPLPSEQDLSPDASPCETCITEEQEAAKPAPAEPGFLVDRAAALIRAEFPDTHPHSRVNRLRAELSAARILTFLRTWAVNPAPTHPRREAPSTGHHAPDTGHHAGLRGNPEPFGDDASNIR